LNLSNVLPRPGFEPTVSDFLQLMSVKISEIQHNATLQDHNIRL